MYIYIKHTRTYNITIYYYVYILYVLYSSVAKCVRLLNTIDCVLPRNYYIARETQPHRSCKYIVDAIKEKNIFYNPTNWFVVQDGLRSQKIIIIIHGQVRWFRRNPIGRKKVVIIVRYILVKETWHRRGEDDKRHQQ